MMITPAVFHEDAFHEYFKPQMHLSVEREVWGGYGLDGTVVHRRPMQ